VAPSNLEAERDTLANQGVLNRLSENCKDEMPFSLIYHRPTGGEEIVTAVTPVSTAAGCWAMVASFSEDAFPGAHLGQPYWATPPVIVAALIYVMMAAITFATLLSVRGGLRRFALRARGIRERGPAAGSFADRYNLPELADVASRSSHCVAPCRKTISARSGRSAFSNTRLTGSTGSSPRRAGSMKQPPI
jgi:hypothetical protein